MAMESLKTSGGVQILSGAGMAYILCVRRKERRSGAGREVRCECRWRPTDMPCAR